MPIKNYLNTTVRYRFIAEHAQIARFEEVEIYAANGCYLIDPLLRDKMNQRSDNYGGSIANQLQLMLGVKRW
jgi:N-ethylmaleimide reductase